MESSKLRSASIDISAFLLIWCFLVFLQFSVIGYTFYHFPIDSDLSNFSFGLNWLTMNPGAFSQPSPTLNILSGVIAGILNVDLTDAPLRKFITITVFIQGITVLIAATWFSWSSSILRLSLSTRGLLVLVTFSFPPILMFSGHWNYVFMIGILGLPLGLTLLAALQGNSKALIIGGCGCGLLAANYYPSLAVTFSFLAILALRAYSTTGRPRLRGYWVADIKRQKNIIFLLFIILLGSPLISHIFYTKTQEWPLGKDFLWVIYRAIHDIPAWLVISVCVIFLIRWDKGIRTFIFWMLIAFILGNSILLPWYMRAVTSDTALLGTLTETLPRLILIVDFPWLIVLWFFFLTLTLIYFRPLVKKQNEYSVSNLKSLPILFSILLISSVAVAASNYVDPQYLPGLAERIFIAAIPGFAVGSVAIINGIPKKYQIFIRLTIILLCSVAAVDWYQKYSDETDNNRLEGNILDRRIEQFFDEYLHGKVICIRNEYNSRYCSTAFAYNRYRTKESANSFPTRNLFNGRVIYIWPNDDETVFESDIGSLEVPFLVISGEYNDRFREFFLSRGVPVKSVTGLPVNAFTAMNNGT